MLWKKQEKVKRFFGGRYSIWATLSLILIKRLLVLMCDSLMMKKTMIEYRIKPTIIGEISVWLVWILAVLLLISAGITYRVLASGLKIVVDTPIILPIPLSAFPTEIIDWTGRDVAIPQNIQRVAGNDDFINRLYTNKSNNQWANVYIAYCARPRNMVGHRPDVCYVGGGWVHDSTQQSQFISAGGKAVPCLIHRFHRPAPETDEVVVLNFYILNGQITADESGFSGVGWRTPNIAGNPARYVSQVQISSVLENSVRLAAKDMTDIVLDYLPDGNGKVKATEYSSLKSSVLK